MQLFSKRGQYAKTCRENDVKFRHIKQMLNFIKRFFVWWQDYTIGTWLDTVLHGQKVGTDGGGNIYYETRDKKRRWVIYNGDVEASRVPAEWHGWLHKTVDEPPTINPPKVKDWQKPHKPNLTGKKGAYFPPGSLVKGGKRNVATGDYEAWKP